MGGARSTRHSRDVSPRRAAVGARAGIRRIRHGRVREPRSVARALRTSETPCGTNAAMVPQPRWWPYTTCTISMLGASRAAHVIEEVEHAGWRCFLGLAVGEDVPVRGARHGLRAHTTTTTMGAMMIVRTELPTLLILTLVLGISLAHSQD